MAGRRHRFISFAKGLSARRGYPCPRCHARIPNSVPTCYRCGWSDRVTTANLEAMAGYLASGDTVGSGFGGDEFF